MRHAYGDDERFEHLLYTSGTKTPVAAIRL
jgi:hypothetical protein